MKRAAADHSRGVGGATTTMGIVVCFWSWMWLRLVVQRYVPQPLISLVWRKIPWIFWPLHHHGVRVVRVMKVRLENLASRQWALIKAHPSAFALDSMVSTTTTTGAIPIIISVSSIIIIVVTHPHP